MKQLIIHNNVNKVIILKIYNNEKVCYDIPRIGLTVCAVSKST